jgi:hypothetical protein
MEIMRKDAVVAKFKAWILRQAEENGSGKD